MLNRKIAVLLFSGAALAAQAGLAAADETEIGFWSKNPRNVAAEQLIKAPQTREEQKNVVTPEKSVVTPERSHTRGPVTNPTDEFYYRQTGGVPAA